MANSDDDDFLASLDDDLNDDWESAFQAEDFMLSPEGDDNDDFFLMDENNPADNADLNQLKKEQEQTESTSTEEQSTSSKLNLVGLALFFHTLKSLPTPKKIAFGTVPVFLTLGILALLFFNSTNEELAQRSEENTKEPVVATAPIIPEKSADERIAAAIAKLETTNTIRRKWNLPSFLIVTNPEKEERLYINIDLTLIATLEQGEKLPYDQQVFVRDIIYKFYHNRPPYELKKFAIARGEMIHKLNRWIKKEWPDSPIDSIIFSKYHVITPKSPLS